MSIKINGTDVVDNNRKGIFQSANLGVFTPSTRPGSAATGDMIYNSTEGKLQFWNGSAWTSAGGAQISATGGTTSTSSDGFYTLHTFTSPGTFTLNTNGAVIDVFLIGGGGCGGNGSPIGGGGGGGGHVLEFSRVWASGSYSVSIGAGGAARTHPYYQLSGGNGGNTTFQCPPSVSAPGTLTALGGGGGGGGASPGIPPTNPNRPLGFAQAGGCGGGGSGFSQFYLPGTPSDTNQGGGGLTGGSYRQSPYQPISYFGGGGGGIGALAGYSGGDQYTAGSGYIAFGFSRGVDGLYLKWASPTRAYYGGGGFGGPITTPYNPGGFSNPVQPAYPSTARGTGSANTGGGGNGWNGPTTGSAPPTGAGYSGVVIIRYAKVQNL